jgi:hypothetical protein
LPHNMKCKYSASNTHHLQSAIEFFQVVDAFGSLSSIRP